MKLKKLAAGACALALGAAMLVMPASAETFTAAGSSHRDVTATGKTNHAYAVDFEWNNFEFTYERTWNPDTLQYDYDSNTWEGTSASPELTVTNRSDVGVTYSTTITSVASGVTVDYSEVWGAVPHPLAPAYATSGTWDGTWLIITGTPDKDAGQNGDTITLCTLTATLTIDS